MAAFKVCQARLAHLTRTGNALTPENAASLPRSSRSKQGSWPPVIIWWKRLKVSEASANDLPFTTEVIIDADALAMAQPSPWKLMSRMTPSLTSRYTVT